MSVDGVLHNIGRHCNIGFWSCNGNLDLYWYFWRHVFSLQGKINVN